MLTWIWRPWYLEGLSRACLPSSLWLDAVRRCVTRRQLLEQQTIDGCTVASLILPVLFSPATFPNSWVHGHHYTWACILTAFRKGPFSWLQLRRFCYWAIGESQNQEEYLRVCVLRWVGSPEEVLTHTPPALLVFLLLLKVAEPSHHRALHMMSPLFKMLTLSN